MWKSALLSVWMAWAANQLCGQVTADPSLSAEIDKIKAVDNHTHVSKVVAAGESDRDFDALPCDVIEGGADTLATRADNPQFLEAWRSLYGYAHKDREKAHVQELVAAREKVMRAQGDNFPTWVLDRLGIQYMLANRVAMGRGLNPPRFLWVPFDDALTGPALPRFDEAAFLRCCGSRKWAAAMAARAPFEDRAALLRIAERTWWSLGEADHLEAFAAHPKIGEAKAPAPATRGRRRRAGRRRRGAAADARRARRREPRVRGRSYGFIFIVCASGPHRRRDARGPARAPRQSIARRAAHRRRGAGEDHAAAPRRS